MKNSFSVYIWMVESFFIIDVYEWMSLIHFDMFERWTLMDGSKGSIQHKMAVEILTVVQQSEIHSEIGLD